MGLMEQLDQTSPAQTCDIIVSLATPLFADKGYDGVSMRDISDAVGITAGAIYHHFSGKQELFEQAVSRAFATVTQVLLADLPVLGSPRDRLAEAVRRLARYNFAAPAEMRLVDRVIFDGAPIQFPRIMNRLRHGFAALISDAQGNAPAEEIAEHLIASVYGATKLQNVRAAFQGGDWFKDVDAYADSLSGLILRSLDSYSRD